MTNLHTIEIEGTTISGSVFIHTSTVEFAGNSVGGSAHCQVVTAFTDGDHTPNSVGGSNDCP